jgi:hypothetical protein
MYLSNEAIRQVGRACQSEKLHNPCDWGNPLAERENNHVSHLHVESWSSPADRCRPGVQSDRLGRRLETTGPEAGTRSGFRTQADPGARAQANPGARAQACPGASATQISAKADNDRQNTARAGSRTQADSAAEVTASPAVEPIAELPERGG